MNVLKKYLSIAEFEAIIFNNNKVLVEDTVYQTVNESFEFLKSFAADKIIYGVNTGFGPMAQYKIEKEKQKKNKSAN